MVARRKKRYETGEASKYLSRKQALAKLQLTLKDFRRLCILKGIHPREPRSRKRAQKGNLNQIKTLFYEKDIRFLLHEPINQESVDRLRENKPKYSLDHIVKERYPSFVDAIRDLEDCLCLVFLFSTFPSCPKSPNASVNLCRRLSIEWMHFIIEARALRKVFVSIKGIYYQVEVMGQTVTWIVPHNFAYDTSAKVDMRLLSIFTEFYTTMLGFINYRLYHNLNLKYPPVLPSGAALGDEDDEIKSERVAALNQSLARTLTGEEETVLDTILDEEQLTEAKKRADEITRLSTLFKGLKFYINREVPREALVFMIRSFGGEVSWDPIIAGSTFKEKNTSITHQICDRSKESMGELKVGRDYIQPQWVFDSINNRELLPTHKYFIGEMLPPHLSPFIADRRIGDYAPPEEVNLFQSSESTAKEDEEVDDVEMEDEEDLSEEEASDDEFDKTSKSMKVEEGKSESINKDEEKKKLEDEEYRLRVMMIKNKHRGLYKSMMKSRNRRTKEANLLTKKRQEYDDKTKVSSNKKKRPRLLEHNSFSDLYYRNIFLVY
ncbi:PES1 [Lepeophtheirus salmonis]|uniref:Pescadillo homolog n=1 Tax=Lepeophtheirus salmonis TaxID=72036 RepID=A0A7R8H639_LEPSM|nr:PES1 [Lepeophtheirus salmonis]CAF2894644.1 PES1 [Lepeophtheirus salmonis]